MFQLRRGVLGFLIGLAGHGLAFLFGWIAAQVVQPSEGGGFEDVASVAVTFIVIEILLAIASPVAGGILIAKGRKDLGLGLIAGWIIGIAAIWALLNLVT